MIVLRSLITRLNADSSQFLRGMNNAGNAVRDFERNVTRRFDSIRRTVGSVHVLIGGALVTALTRAAQAYTKTADEAGKFADSIGTSVEQLTRLEFAGDLSGVSMENLRRALVRQVDAISEAQSGTGTYADALSDLNLSYAELASQDPVTQFLSIAQALEGVESQTERVRITQDLWGRSGTELLRITNQGTEAIEAMMQESDAFSHTLGSDLAASSATFNDEMTRLMASLRGLANTVMPLVLPGLTNFVEGIRLAIQGVITLVRWIKDLGRELIRLATDNFAVDALGMLAPNMAEAIRNLGRYEQEQRKVNETTRQTIAILDENNRKVGELNESTGALTIGVSTNNDEIDDYIKSLKEQQDAFEMTQRKIEALVQWFHALDPSEQAENWRFFIEELRRLGAVVDVELSDSIRTWQILMEESLKRVDAAFLNFWEGVLQGNKSVFENFKSLALSILAEIIHEYTTKVIVARIIQVVSGGQQQEGAGNALRATNATISGAVSGAPGGTLGVIAGGLVGLVGAVLTGSLLANLLGDDDSVKESQLFVGNLRDEITGALSTNIPSPFGRNISFGFNRIGNRGQLGNTQARQILQTLENLGEVMTGFDQLIADTLSATQLQNVDRLLGEVQSGSFNYSPERVDTFIRQRFTAVFTGVDEALGDVFSEFSTQFESDELLRFVQDVTNLQVAFSRGERVFTDLATVAETVNTLMSEFTAQGESLAGVLERIRAANGILGALGLEGNTVAGARFNLSVLEQFGNDIGTLSELVAGFFDAFVSEEETLRRAIGQMQAIVPESLARLDTSRATFAADFLERLSSGLLDPIDVRNWLVAGDALAQLIDLENELLGIRRDAAQQAITEQIAAIDAQVQSLNASSSAILEQISIQQQLQAQIAGISAGLEQSFARTNEDIYLSVVSPRNQIQFLQQRIDELVSGISVITDPEILRATLEEIRQRTVRQFNLLDPSEQPSQAIATMRSLDDVLAQGQERLAELAAQSAEREQNLLDQQQAIDREIAELNREAAQVQSQASRQFANAVEEFSSSASRLDNSIAITIRDPDFLVNT